MNSPTSIAIAVLVVGLLVLELLRRRAVRQAAEARTAALETEARLSPLRKYEAIQDAELEADRIRSAAESASASQQETARREADRITSEAQHSASESRTRSKQALDDAIAESSRILESANRQAHEIAGDALKAKDKAEHYARAARAMKNIMDGYGEEYLIANRTVLDELAEDFGHREAGQKLKEARSHTRGLVKNSLAADCDYVEPHRRTTAIQFVLDAFNGKVDTALAKARHNNYGKLKQEILDGHGLVNKNGQAFRGARITPDYLDARLDELKWAVATNELKLEEREEQRRIRETMREEERARREYDKAQKEALREEKLIQKAMTEARKRLEAASDEQRSAFQSQLAELQGKYEEAEAKNQRAISMAQQTRQGHVYVISNVGSFGQDVFKIGLTRRLEPTDRVRELGDASVPFPFDIHAMIHSDDAPALEDALHKRFSTSQVNRVNRRKEFFRIGVGEIRTVVEGMEIEAHWTMAAEAREFRETQALAQSVSEEAEESPAVASTPEDDLLNDLLSES